MTDPHHHSPLEASVLVLNKMFMAVHVISVRRAFCLLCKELAEVVTLEDGQFATYSFSSWTEVSAFNASNESSQQFVANLPNTPPADPGDVPCVN